ncbi:MAG: aminoglycoside phosphotransferase family protein [Actinomycetota bacterium]
MVWVPEVVRNKAEVNGAGDWVARLPGLIDELCRRWSITLTEVFDEGTEAYVAAGQTDSGDDVVLKIGVPNRGPQIEREALVLRLADGDGCARLLAEAPEVKALLLERLGPSLSTLGLPLRRRHEILVDTAARIWRPVPEAELPTGADKARWLIEFAAAEWERLDRPCSEAAVAHAIACAERREAAHDDETAVLVHGDVHEWNVLQHGSGYKLVDPDGLRAEPAYDLGVIMREDPEPLLSGDPWDRAAWERAHWLAQRTGVPANAIWEWGVVERVSTGLVATGIDLQPVAAQMLLVADRIAPGG